MKCEGCGREVSVVGYFLGPCYSHEKNDTTCLRNQLLDAKQRITKLENVIGDTLFELQTVNDFATLTKRLEGCLTPKP